MKLTARQTEVLQVLKERRHRYGMASVTYIELAHGLGGASRNGLIRTVASLERHQLAKRFTVNGRVRIALSAKGLRVVGETPS